MFSFKSNKKRPIDFFGILFTYECIVFLLHICVMRRCMARTKESYRIFFNNRFRYLIITCAVSSVWGFPPFLCLLFFTCIIFKLKLFWFSYFIDLCYNIKLFDYVGWRYFFFHSFDFIVLTTNSALLLCIFGIFSSLLLSFFFYFISLIFCVFVPRASRKLFTLAAFGFSWVSLSCICTL